MEPKEFTYNSVGESQSVGLKLALACIGSQCHW